MKIYCPNISQQKIGGGFTFMKNFKRGMVNRGHQIVLLWAEADVVLVSSASTTDVNEIVEAKNAGKKIIFRVDNIPKKSRNKRGRIYDKMRQFAKLADHIVFQSYWALKYAGFITGYPEKSVLIYNGVDQKIFYPANDKIENKNGGKKYIYVQFNRDENKRFPEAAYLFHMAWRENHNHKLTLVGQFSPELVEAGFDFFAGEDVEYISPIEDQNVMADLLRGHDILLFPAFADASPNTVLEARACGLEVVGANSTGGTNELLYSGLDISLERMLDHYESIFKK